MDDVGNPHIGSENGTDVGISFWKWHPPSRADAIANLISKRMKKTFEFTNTYNVLVLVGSTSFAILESGQ